MLPLLTILLAIGPQEPTAIIPQPSSLIPKSGSFALHNDTSIVAPAVLRPFGHRLQQYLSPATGFELPIKDRASQNAIVLRLSSANALGNEGYRLQIGPNEIQIVAKKPAGLFYGMQTLRQLLPPQIFRRSRMGGIRWSAPCVVIEDVPRFGWRGAHMDVARHFMPKEFVMKFLDLMALHKLNTFHWHLVDDNGWRVQIKRYPKLTEIGSKNDFSAMNPSGATRSINQQAGGFYTQEDIREIVQYAKERFITIMPEIEMPGHSKAAIDSYPELGNRIEIEAAGGDAKFLGNYDNVYNVEDATIKFVKNVLDEILDLFPSKFIHVGGDEVWKDPWKNNPRAQERKKALGLKSEDELQSWFIKQFDDYMVAKGRRLIGWDEILEGGLAPNAAVMSWRGIDGGIAAAKAGHDVVMAPNGQTYFDHYQARFTESEPKAIGGYLPIETVYGFEPIPPSLTPGEARHILGAQAQLWSEFIPHPKHMEYMAYPRFCALSEVLWSPKGSRNYPSFLARLKLHLKRLDVLDVNYRPLDKQMPKPVGFWKSGETTETFAVKEWDLTRALNLPGEYQVVFSYTNGDHRLDIAWAELTEDGISISRDEHPGMTGGEQKDNRYRISIKEIKPGARYVLRANVRSDGGNDSNGEIYLIKK